MAKLGSAEAKSGKDLLVQPPKLRRVVSLPMLVLYGLGVTIGAGIYVLVGATAARAGEYAPSSFLLSALVMAFSAASFAEFVGRVPKAAGEAAYVSEGFGNQWLTVLTGGLVIFAAIVAAAAIAIGCAGYVAELVPLWFPTIIVIVIVSMGLIAAWGIQESIMFAGTLTVIEVCGLLVIIGAGFAQDPGMLRDVGAVFPPIGDGAAMTAVLSASLLAFFAFIGFDDVVNLAEETPNPRRAMPWAIVISLVAVTLIYFLVIYVALRSVGPEELAASRAPVGLLFERLTGLSPFAITLIAVVATANGIVIQIIMASRVAYGLTSQERVNLPWFGMVNRRTQTPLNATVTITALVLGLALFVDLEFLAELTSQIILIVFALVNAALIRVKLRGVAAPAGTFTVPLIVPAIGVVTCVFLLLAPVFL